MKNVRIRGDIDMYYLAPSILGADFKKLAEDIQAVDRAGAQLIHIDVMDGVFVPSISFGMPVIQSIRSCTNRVFDVHLMITEPIRYIDDFVKAGADRITIHVEACKDVQETLDAIKKAGVEVGISLSPNTPPEAIFPYLKDVQQVLVMSVEPGFGGQSYLEGSDEKIKAIRAKIDELSLDIDISVDGGIKLDNAQRVLEAGANVLVAGSSVFKDDVEKNVKDFLEIFEKH